MNKIVTSFFILSWFIAGSVLANITPNDTFYNRQWYLSKIKANQAWTKISASPDVVIAVIDSGIQIIHPDLRDNIWNNKQEIPNNKIDDDQNGFIDDYNGWNFIDNTPDPSPRFSEGWTETGVSHGTMVAGIIAAKGNNLQGVVGVTWQAQIMPLKVLDEKGEGRISNVIRAIDYAVNNGADIINLSFVSFDYSQGFQEAIRRAHQAGVIVVAAAGNEQTAGEGYNIDKTPIYPACYDGQLIGENMVIGVAATDALDQKTSFSSYGFSCIDLVAPGISFFNTITGGSNIEDPGRFYDGYWSGTSMAAPLVSATLALIEQANPELNRREVVNILFASTDNISRLNPNYLGQLGNGRLNTDKAVEMAKNKLYNYLERLLIFPVSGQKNLKMTDAAGDLIKNLPIELIELNNGSSISAGDVNGDGQDEIIVGNGPGNQPEIKIFNQAGELLKKFLVFDEQFRGGVNLTISDLDDNGQAEIIVVPSSNGSPEIRIFDYNGRLKKQFFVDSKNWRGGLSVAAGDLDGKGNKQIVVGYGAGRDPQIRILDSSGKLLGVFFAYEKNFRGGVNVAVANIDGRKEHNKAEIIVSPGKGREPQIKIFDNHAQLKKQFLAYGKNWQGGVNLIADDIDNDGIGEIVVGAYPGAAPHIRIFDDQGILLESFYTWEESFNGGANIGIIKINN